VMARLCSAATERRAQALALAAVRETFEEVGLLVGAPAEGAVPRSISEDWKQFFATGMAPALDKLTYVYRAITPPGRPRRFNARFFVIDAEHVQGDMSEGSGELLKLHWFSLDEARALKIRPITKRVLDEIDARIESGDLHDPSRPVPAFRQLHGKRVEFFD